MSADATQVTGSPIAGPGAPRPGAVLAERYELLELIDGDGPALSFRALDQESERQVLVRILAGPGVHTDVCDDIVDHLDGLVGIGGRYLASLLDADREGRTPFTVEAWPLGTPLSAILDSRRGRGEALGPREALPVIAQLAAALHALPDGLHHGDVRPERVWLDTDGLRLTGPFLLAALPADELGERVSALGPGAVAYPPEARRGATGPASDLWGVASIAWEALTGRSPDPSVPAPEVEGDLRDALVSLLDEAPERRPPDLEALLQAVARHAELSIPNLDPEPHQPPTAFVSDLDGVGTEPSASANAPSPDPNSLDPRLVRAALGLEMDVERPSGPNDTAKHDAVSADQSAAMLDSLDPRLVRAALGVSMDSDSASGEVASREDSDDALDPRLVRAALGVSMDSDSLESLELGEDEIEEIEELDEIEDIAPKPKPKPKSIASAESPARPAPRPPSARGGLPPPGRPIPKPRPRSGPPKPFPTSGGLDALDEQSTEPEAPEPKPLPSAPPPSKLPRAAAPRRAPTPEPEPAATPAPPAPEPAAKLAPPAPAPKPMASPAPAAPSPAPRAPAPTAPSPAPAPARASTPQPPAPRPPSPAPAPPLASPSPPAASFADYDTSDDKGTEVVGPNHRRVARTNPAPAKKPRRKVTGVIIVVVALLIAVAIVGFGFLIASQRREDAARQRELDERIQQLRDEGSVVNE